MRRISFKITRKGIVRFFKRLGLGFLGPLWLSAAHPLLAATLAILGDLIDRAEYYDELDVATPEADLRARLREGSTAAPAR